MGTQKDKEIEEEDRWNEIAREKGYICDRCGNVIPKSEYTVGSKMCGYCRHMINAD